MNKINNYRQDLTTHYLINLKTTFVDKKKITIPEKVKDALRKIIKF